MFVARVVAYNSFYGITGTNYVGQLLLPSLCVHVHMHVQCTSCVIDYDSCDNREHFLFVFCVKCIA